MRESPTPAPPEYPTSFNGIVGQEEIVTLLQLKVQAARREGKPLGHMLFYGPPGTGKARLCHLLARKVNYLLYESSGAEFPNRQAIVEA